MSDAVNHPPHYNQHPSGVECIQIAEHYGFCIGNAIKYLWRAGLKGDAVEDLEKARWYLDREITRRKKIAGLGCDQSATEMRRWLQHEALIRQPVTADQTQQTSVCRSPAEPAWQSFAGRSHAHG